MITRLDHQENLTILNLYAFELWCWRRLLRVPWAAPWPLVNPTGNQSWIFIGRTDAEAATPILWPLDAKNWLTGKDPDSGKDWRQDEKGTTEDEKVGWHHWLDRHEFEQAPGVGDGLGSLACCSPWGCKESDTTEQLNWTEQVSLTHVPSWLNTQKGWGALPMCLKGRETAKVGILEFISRFSRYQSPAEKMGGRSDA